MRAPLPLLALLLATPAAAQNAPALNVPQPPRKMKEVMIDALDDPKVQAAVRVTETQRTLATIRLQREVLKFGLDVAARVLKDDLEGGPFGPSPNVSLSPGGLLYPFLAANQLGILRREALRRAPYKALNTDEVAFAVGLSPAQRTRLSAFFVETFRKALKTDRPSVRVVNKALADAAAESKKMETGEDESGLTPENLAIARRGVDRLFAAMERATVLAAKEKWPGNPDPLPLLTPAQRARYRALSKG